MRVVVIDFVEHFGLEIFPAFEGKRLAEDARVGIGGYQRRLDEERSRAAHRVDKVLTAIPTCLEQQSGGKHLVDRRFRLVDTIAALVERFA